MLQSRPVFEPFKDRMNRHFTFILLLIAVVLSAWYVIEQQKDENILISLTQREGLPEYTGHGMSAMIYDLKGHPQYFAKAQEIKRFEASERTEFIYPQLNLFEPETASEQWQILADFAEVTKDKMLYLSGNVKVIGLLPDSRLSSIETDKLSVDLTTQDIFTESDVKSVGMGFVTTGTGLTGNLKKQLATLTKNVKTYIQPTVIKSIESRSKNE